MNPVHSTPLLMNSVVPSIGLSNISIISNNSWLTCSFTRMISMPSQEKYFDLSNPFYVLAAFGSVGSEGNFNI